MKNLRLLERLVWNVLKDSHRGRENIIPMSSLADKFGVDTRKLQLVIRQARLSGLPIASAVNSGSHGYFIPATLEEARPFREQMYKRRDAISRSLKVVDRALDEMFGGQMHFEIK